ncbi:MAG: putative hydrolase of the superfamily [Actinomycetota bacterium]|jgi:putative hydrolase of the HAD superfamily|nr:putative hydrolase of the superfamily [Actinomycetota bacterium]
MSQRHSVPTRRAFDGLIVDFGGVLTNPLQEGFEAFAESLGIELQDLVRVMLPIYTGMGDDTVERFEKGELDEAEFSLQLARRLEAASGGPVEAEGLVARVFAGVHLEPAMLDGVAVARRAGLKTALLSNSWGMSGYPRDRFGELFDAVIISGEVGLRKPDPAIYELAVEGLRVPPERCVFVDDYPGHLEPAIQAGMTTVLHVSTEQTLSRLSDLLGVSLQAA